jgi:hypothetical protein
MHAIGQGAKKSLKQAESYISKTYKGVKTKR